MTRPASLPLPGPLTREEFERRLTDFVNRSLLKSAEAPVVDAETPLFESGVINSLRILDLIAFVEKTLDVRIPDKAVRLQNFRSIRTIARFLLAADAAEAHGAP